MRHTVTMHLVAWSLALTASQAARGNEKIYDQTLKATAWVVAHDGPRAMYGTAAVIDLKKKLLVTNAHVVGQVDEVTLYFAMLDEDEVVSDPREYLANAPKVEARVLLVDREKDLALLEACVLPEGVGELKLAGKSARPGQRVHSIGNSGFRGGVLWRYTKGDVRQVYTKRLITDVGLVEARVLETDAAINRGDSGGPVVNEAGELVGVVQSFDPENRLITNNIDVREVKDLVERSQCPTAPAVAGDGLAGNWRMSFADADGAELFFDATIRADGSMTLRGKDTFNARYSLKNGTLRLTMTDELTLEGKLLHSGRDRFAFEAEGTMFTFTRVK
jgi:hypothetical protein